MYYKTSIVYNDPNKLVGLDPYIYRYRTCDTNLTSNTPANRYQRQKLIQNTVRVYASLYTANLAPLAAYAKPTRATNNVCWNQMSDRPFPSVQKVTVPTGFFNSLNNKHYSVTSSRPGGQTPGGVGCDIKHNSYDRYLNRLKGKGPLRRGRVPETIILPNIPFNPAFPIYGGKLFKTAIVSGCKCPDDIINPYNNPFYKEVEEVIPGFIVGQSVYALKNNSTTYVKAIINIVNSAGTYDIMFEDGIMKYGVAFDDLKTYYPCHCNTDTEKILTI